ncbi:hypothetical protein OG609_26185 [Streptomyces sp. NBC_01224]|uniref:hypothetical protein n=1 Tax=unclassified Streptomyces TaxID=2593676 RepID=UPI002E13B3D3|nr:hypothetical protein OG609_26185 [Streptomyces sp. NBC_01224]
MAHVASRGKIPDRIAVRRKPKCCQIGGPGRPLRAHSPVPAAARSNSLGSLIAVEYGSGQVCCADPALLRVYVGLLFTYAQNRLAHVEQSA